MLCAHSMFLLLCVCADVSVDMRARMFLCVCFCVHVSVSICVHVSVCACVRVSVSMYVHDFSEASVSMCLHV